MYHFIMKTIKGLIRLVNGPIKIEGLDQLPQDEKFIVVAPHRSMLDPVFIAVASLPHTFMFMAKQELFKIPIFSWLIKKVNAFPVDRDNPQVSAIKTPVKALRENELNLVIFPTGSRYSDEMKNGATTIARLSKRPIVPAVYDGPLTIGGLFTRKQTAVRFGKPFYVQRKIDGVTDINQYYNDKMEQAFSELLSK